MLKGFSQSELQQIDDFLKESQGLPEEEILVRLALLATSLNDRVSLLFLQLEQDIETTLRILSTEGFKYRYIRCTFSRFRKSITIGKFSKKKYFK